MILAYLADRTNMTLGASLVPLQPVAGPSRAVATTPLCCVEADARQPPFEPLKMMRAIHVETFGGPEVLQLKSNLIVPPLTKSQVLVRVKCTGVNPVILIILIILTKICAHCYLVATLNIKFFNLICEH